jgi:hypothetical protein
MEKIDFKVIVCGGREYGWTVNANRQKVINQQEVKFLFDKLDVLKRSVEELERKLIIIQGEAVGADSWAKKWAEINSVECRGYPANWDEHKKAAGPIRNKRMLTEENPDLVIAFKGGNGTAHMCQISEAANVPVKRY